MPIFSNVDGRICINFTYSSILPALHELGRELTPEEAEAIEILRGVLVRQQVEVRMQPGDAAMANNYAHVPLAVGLRRRPRSGTPSAAAAGVDGGPDRGPPAARSAASSSTWRTRVARSGYDPVPGREGRIAINDYNNVDEDLANLFKAAQAKPKLD